MLYLIAKLSFFSGNYTYIWYFFSKAGVYTKTKESLKYIVTYNNSNVCTICHKKSDLPDATLVAKIVSLA